MSTFASDPCLSPCPAALAEPDTLASRFFPQSVASGEPDAGGVLLWTRAVDPTRPERSLPLTLQVAHDARFLHRVLELPGLRTTSAHDHTLKVRVTGLAPSTNYHYRFVLEGRGRQLTSPGGRTRTGPATSAVSPVHFVVASAWELLGGDDGLWQRLLWRDEDPDFILLWGDSLLEVDATPRQCRTARAHPTLREVYARYPLLLLWEPGSRAAERWSARPALWDYLPVSPWKRRPTRRGVRGGSARPTCSRASASFVTR